MTASVKERLEERSAANVERTSSLRTVDLVSGDGEQLATDLLHVHRNLACCLNCVGVEQHTTFLSDATDLGYRLNDSGLVVRHHDADEARVRTNCGSDRLWIDETFRVHGNISDFTANLL